MERTIPLPGGERNLDEEETPGRLGFKSTLDGRRKPSNPMERSRNFFHNRFVYALISQRARGLSLGVNMNPDKFCNFDCVYCEVNRTRPSQEGRLEVDVMCAELRAMLLLVSEGRVRELPGYQSLPDELVRLKEVALSGDGEPTLCPNFAEIVEAVTHVRAQGGFPFFKIVLITNATRLHLPQVQSGLKLFTSRDEVWAKLDAGSQPFLEKVNRPKSSGLGSPVASLAQVLDNVRMLGHHRPVVIQSLFPSVNGQEPRPEEIEEYVHRLRELKEGGAQISLVQVYSAHRLAAHPECGHLPLKTLSHIAQRVRDGAGLKAEVF